MKFSLNKKNLSKYIFLTIGIILLVIIFKNVGLAETLNNIKKVGWLGFLLIVSIHLVSNISFAFAWRLMLQTKLKAKDHFKILCARIAGDATSAINSLGALAGEPLKAMYIRDLVPFKTGLASVVMDRTVRAMASFLIILTGIIVSFFVLDLSLYISLISLAVVLLGIIAIFWLMKKQNQGFLQFLVSKMPKKLQKKLLTEKRLTKMKELDAEITIIFSSKHNQRNFFLALFIHYTMSIFINTLEIFLIVRYCAATSGLTVLDSMFIYIFGFLMTTAIFFMPGNVGTSEGSYALALKFLGYDPSIGLTIGILRRLRSFIWAGLGMILLFYAGLLKKNKKENHENYE